MEDSGVEKGWYMKRVLLIFQKNVVRVCLKLCSIFKVI